MVVNPQITEDRIRQESKYREFQAAEVRGIKLSW